MRLVRGQGSPETGACWMSAIAWYAGEQEWTDAPDCVCPMIRRLAIWVNDALPSDAERERVIGPAIFTVVGTRTDDDAVILERRRVLVRFAAKCARRVVHLATDWAVAMRAIEAAERWADDPSEANQAAAHAAYAIYASAAVKPAIIADAMEAIAAMAAIGDRVEIPHVRDLCEIPAYAREASE